MPAASASPLVEAPAVLDVEASGFGPGSYPIEVGYVLPNGQSFCTLIRPEPAWVHWDPQAERLHHISRERAIEHGRGAADVAQMLNQRLQGRTVYTDAWLNDYTWLALLYDVAGMRPAFRLDSLRALLSEGEASHWHEAKQQVSREADLQRHRASADARLLQLTLSRVREARPGA